MSYCAVDIDMLGLSNRASNALRKNGINNLSELMEYSENELLSMPGVGRTCAEEIQKEVNKWSSFSAEELEIAEKEYDERKKCEYELEPFKLSFNDYVECNLNEKTINILEAFFARTPRTTLDSIGKENGITRERVRQILISVIKKFRKAIQNDDIDCSDIEVVKKAAEEITEISFVNVHNDSFIGRTGLVRLIASIYDDEIKIISHKRLHGEWVAKKEYDIAKAIDNIVGMLGRRDSPMKIEDVLIIFPIPEEMLLSIENIIEKEGYITLSTNKIASGTSRDEILRNFLHRVGRPVSVDETVNATGLSESQVRSRFSNSDLFVNVGKSVYDLAYADYSDESVSILTRNILLAENRALKLDAVIKYVQKYREMDDWDVSRELLYCPSPIVYRKNEYILLNEWGLDKIEIPVQKHYLIRLEDAIMDVVSEIVTAGEIATKLRDKYGGAVSTNLNSVKQSLGVLAQQERIARVGNNTGCYRRATF